MPLLNSYLRAFFRSALPSQCTPIQDYILLVPTTEVLTNTRDRETGTMYSDLVEADEFLGSHVLRVPNGNAAGAQSVGGRETRGKAKQFTTFNGRTVVIKDTWIYSNKGFRSLNQAQLLHDALYYPDVIEPDQWLIYFISKPLVGSLEYVSTVPPYLREQPPATNLDYNSATPSPAQNGPRKKLVRSFNELLMLFPMVARQMQPGLEKLFHEFEMSFERFKPLPLPPPSPSSTRSGVSTMSSKMSVHSSVNGDVYKQAADESEIRKSLEAAITAAVDLFQRVDQSQLDLLASTTDLTGSAVDRLIERYVTEQLHDTTLFPRLCATQAIEDEELEHKILAMENVDLAQVGIPSVEGQEKQNLADRVAQGIVCFERIGRSKSPQAMVEHLLETARALTKVDAVENGDSDAAKEKVNPAVVIMNADMLVSLLLMVVIRAKVPSLHACLSYMRNFVFVEDVEQGEVGYVLSTLEAVLFHIAQDHILSSASQANEQLWRSVRRGNISATKKILGRKYDDEESQSSSNNNEGDDEDENASVSFEDELCSAINESLQPPPNFHMNRNSTTEVTEASSSDSGVVNGIFGPVEIETIMAKKTSTVVVSNSLVDIPEASPLLSLLGEEITEEGPEMDVENIDQASPDGSCLTKEGPPPKDMFDTAISPSTGVSSVRIDELQMDANDDSDSINGIQICTSPTPRPSSNTPRTSVARFEVREQRKPLTLLKPRFARTWSSVSLPSIGTMSDASISLSICGTTISQAKDAFSVEKLSQTRNPRGESILMMAIQERKAHMLKYLLETPFFDVKSILDDASNDGTTLLSAAVQAQDMASINILLQELLVLPIDILKQFLMKQDVSGRTVAHYLFNVPDLVGRLGKLLPWKQRDKNGQTPLFALCRSYDHPRYREMVGAAIKQAQASQRNNARLLLEDHIDGKGNTLLHIAGDPGVIKMLLKCDCNVNAVNDKGFTSLMVASKYGRIGMVRALFADSRVDLLAKEFRGLTAVELAKDDDVRNRIDDLMLFQNSPSENRRITSVVRSFFVEDASIRFVLKSGAPSDDDPSTFTVTTCRRSLTDFQFLAHWLQFENPASWLPALPVSRSPYQIASKPSRAVLRDIQLRVDNFMRTLLVHPTFSTHELLWEFFLVPEVQQDTLIERSKRKAEARSETVREDYTPIEDIQEVEMFVSFAKDSIRSINYACQSVTRRATNARSTMGDLPDVYKNVISHLNGFKFLQDSVEIAVLVNFANILIPNESHPYNMFIEDFRNIQCSVAGVSVALERPRLIINEIFTLQKQVDKHLASIRRSDRWPLGLLDDTRAKYQQEAAQKAEIARGQKLELARELRYTQSVAAQELAAFHDIHTKHATRIIRELARKQVIVEKDRLESMKRALRVLKSDLR